MEVFETRERKLLGVCVWLSDRLGVDVSMVRLAFILAFIFGLGSPGLIYIILYFFRPSGY